MIFIINYMNVAPVFPGVFFVHDIEMTSNPRRADDHGDREHAKDGAGYAAGSRIMLSR